MTGRVDAHQHYWRLARGDYGWLTPELTAIYGDFGPEDLAPHLATYGIERTVLVQAAPTEAETRFLLDLAGGTPSVAGVVGWTDIEAADAPARIAALARAPRLVGLRPMIHDVADPRWMLSARLAPAFAAIVAADLAFDALVRPVHLRPLLALTGRHPELRVVIDHGAKPAIARWTPGGAEFADWAQELRRLGHSAAIACKVSGLVTEASPDLQAEDLVPYLDALLEAFGPDRLVFGSDWPVVNMAGGYARWLDLLLSWLESRLDPSARDGVLGGNAARVYKLTTG